MLKYVIKRILQLIPVLFFISLVVFVIIRSIPGDPAQIALGEKATPQALAEYRRAAGLDQPLHTQFFLFLWKAVHFDLGKSITYIKQAPVNSILANYFPATIELALAAMFFALLIGIPTGTISAIKQNSLFDYVSMFIALIGVSMPIFWLGLMLILFFSAFLHLFPFSGRIDIGADFQPITNFYVLDSILRLDYKRFLDVLWHLFLPAITLGTVPMAIIARMTRSSLLEVLRQDYILTARAKGVSYFDIIARHAFKNAFIPIITVIGLEFGFLLGGAVLTETVFSWPGMGKLVVDAIFCRDYPLIQGCILLFAGTFVVINLLVDVSYAYFDPRVKYE